MIELIFSDSGAAALAYAKTTGNTSGIVHMEICTDKDGNETVTPFTPPKYTGPKIEGDVADIVSVWLMADVGDIASLPKWDSRTALMQKIADTQPHDPEEWVEDAAKQQADLAQQFITAAEKGEDVRIWWSDMPSESCGYYWAASILAHSKSLVTSIKVPPMLPTAQGYKTIRGTADLTPADFANLLNTQKLLEHDELKAAAEVWQKLVAENAPLRAVINGMPHSVPEDFYDWVLRSALPDREFKIIEAIGLSLIRGPEGLSDWWYAWRLWHLAATGEIELVCANQNFYYSTYKKAK